MRSYIIIINLLVILLAGCCPSPLTEYSSSFDVSLVDGKNALREVAGLTDLGSRHSGTPGAERAATHVFNRLRALGVAAELDVFTNVTSRETLVFRNVYGVIPGVSTNWVVVVSHYDTKSGVSPDFIGANDSGSSTGLLLELARVLQADTPLPYNLLLAFLDGEECQVEYGPHDGLHGSRHLAQQLCADGRAAAVRAVLVADMIGDRDLTLTLPPNITPALGALMLRAAERENIRSACKRISYSILDDHQPFLDAGMPALLIIDFEYGAAPGLNNYWHTVSDNMENISADSLHVVGRLIMRILKDLI